MCHPGPVRPTLRSILESAPLAAAAPEVLSGAERLDTPVRWVHVAEVREVTGLLQGGELILSTGIAMAGSAQDATGYVTELVEAGAAGLVVELGGRLPAVPPEAVAKARRHGFPLVVLHRRARFVEVTESVHRAIVAEQLERVELARSVHEEFTQLSLEAADPAAIVAATAALCGSSVVLEDLARHVVAFTASGRPAGSLLADWERRSRTAPALDGTGIAGPEGWLTTPVGLPGRRWGRLVVPDPQAGQLRLAMVIERAAQALELGRMVERDRLGLELQAQGGLLADLAAGRVDDSAAAARATALGLAPARRYLPVVAESSHPASGNPPSRRILTAEERRVVASGPLVERELVERLARSVKTAGLSGIVGTLPGGSAGVLLGVPPSRAGSPGEKRALDALAATLQGVELRLGVGPASASLTGAGLGLRVAGHVAAVAASMPGEPKPYYRSSDIKLHGLVALLADDPRLQAFVESQLGPLLEHEAQHQSGLLDLLRQHVAAGGNKTRVAATSHRSRPSVYKALARLGRILDADLDDPMTLMSLGVALLAHDHAHHSL